MESFTFYSPTKIYFGKGVLSKAGEAAKEAGANRVFIVYGSPRLEKSGLLAQLTEGFSAAGIAFQAMGGVQPNPTLSFAEKCVSEAKAFGADFLLGLGGGSALDTAKAVAVALANPDTPLWDFYCGKASITKALPIGAALTIPATGSECSNSSVLTNEEACLKRGTNTDWNRPRFALMDPSTGATLPHFQLACSITDIMMHTMDRYFNPIQNNRLTDEIAESVLRVTIESGLELLKNPAHGHALSELFWCGTVSHNDLTGLGGVKDFSPHQLAHAVSAVFGTAHGAALASIWGTWASYTLPSHPARFAQFGRKVWGISSGDDMQTGLKAISRTVDFIESLGLAVSISGAVGKELTEADVKALTDNCMYFGGRSSFGTFVKLGAEDVARIYAAAL